ncbi:MAG: tRNA lysidine(34) synthetase TilS [Deltaproteobacteria bacterium]|nr:tRNA lysidine(34) synthetase TilS [Deltaproteobacteria bacterium]TLN03238.1 MAG: tRNA lysidine(34) synthetase TilS [bacterium]
MLRKVSETIRDNRLFCQGETVVVSVSGGADSVVLLDILSSLTKLRLNLVVAHLNHGLRGKESDDDAAFVEELAARYRLPCKVQRVDVKEISKRRKLSLEEAGRNARYQWFDEVAGSCSAHAIALGHHADDQAETFLLRLFRGSGTTGLASMRLRTSARYVRPLLLLTRDEILSYLERRGLSYRHDSSNDETVFLRNRIRHECLPYLRTFNPAISERLNNTAEALAADDEVLENLVEGLFPRLSRTDSEGFVLNVTAVRSELPGLRYRLYRRALQLLRRDLARIATIHLKQIDRLVHSARTQGEQSIPGGFSVLRCYDELHFLATDKKPGREAWEIRIEGPGSHLLPDGREISICLTAPPENWESLPSSRAYFDPAAFPFPWTLRTIRPGDRFRPFGMSGTRKVKDFFIDGKIPLSVRYRTPLLFAAEELIWVCGLRVSESGRVPPGTRQVAEVAIT